MKIINRTKDFKNKDSFKMSLLDVYYMDNLLIRKGEIGYAGYDLLRLEYIEKFYTSFCILDGKNVRIFIEYEEDNKLGYILKYLWKIMSNERNNQT